MSNIDLLTEEQKQDFIKQVELIDIKQRIDDRHSVETDNYSNYKLLVLIILGIGSTALGGTTITSLSNSANTPTLYTGAAFLILSIITIIIELNVSYWQGLKLAQELAKNDGQAVTSPNNGVILYLIAQASALVSTGLALIFLSLLIGNNETSTENNHSSEFFICPCAEVGL